MNKIKCTSVVDSQGNASKIPLAFDYYKDNKYMILKIRKDNEHRGLSRVLPVVGR